MCDHLALKSTTKYRATKYLMLEDPSLMLSILRKARDQPVPGSLFSRSGGRGERDPGNEVAYALE